MPRPNRQERRRFGRSDPIDAESAARSALSGRTAVVPKLGSSQIECIRVLRFTRQGALKAKSSATNTLKFMVITAPDEHSINYCRETPNSSLHPVGHCGYVPQVPVTHDKARS